MQTAISTLHVGLQQTTAGLQMLHENSRRFKRVCRISDEKKNGENFGKWRCLFSVDFEPLASQSGVLVWWRLGCVLVRGVGKAALISKKRGPF